MSSSCFPHKPNGPRNGAGRDAVSPVLSGTKRSADEEIENRETLELSDALGLACIAHPGGEGDGGGQHLDGCYFGNNNKRTRLEEQVFGKMGALSLTLSLDVSNGRGGGGRGGYQSTGRAGGGGGGGGGIGIGGGGAAAGGRRNRAGKGRGDGKEGADAVHCVKLDLGAPGLDGASQMDRYHGRAPLRENPAVGIWNKIHGSVDGLEPWSLDIRRATPEAVWGLECAVAGSVPHGPVAGLVPRGAGYGHGGSGGGGGGGAPQPLLGGALCVHGGGHPEGSTAQRPRLSLSGRMQHLVSVSLRGGRGVGDEGARALARALRDAVPALRTLNLSGNNLGPVAAEALAGALLGRVPTGIHAAGGGGVQGAGGGVRGRGCGGGSGRGRGGSVTNRGVGRSGDDDVDEDDEDEAMMEAVDAGAGGHGPDGGGGGGEGKYSYGGGGGGGGEAHGGSRRGRGCAALEELDLSGNHIGSEGACVLAGALVEVGCPRLRKLDLTQNLIGARGVAAVAEVLRGQALRGGALSWGGASPGSSSSGTYTHGGSAAAGAAAAAPGGPPSSPSGGTYDVNFNRRGQRGFALEELSLRHNGCGDAGVAALAAAVSDVTAAGLLGREIHLLDGDDDGCKPRFLRVLRLGFNGITSVGAASLAGALSAAARSRGPGSGCSPGPAAVMLTELDLACNSLGPEGARAIADVAETIGTEVLDLGNNHLGDAGAKWVSRALKENTTLRRLSLAGNDIGGDGAWWVANALAGPHCELRSLDLGSNAVGDAGAKDIAEELRVNTALHTLDLRRNGIGADGARELAEALEENATITAVTLRGNAIPLSAAREIRGKQQGVGLRMDVELQQAATRG